ncbi:MAG: diphthine--ammonia ligase [Longimicrobiales bacterium]
MLCALSWSGGKDSALALDRAVGLGHDVRILFNIYEGNTGRVRFHGVRRELIQAQAAALGVELIQRRTHPLDYEAVFLSVLEELSTRGIEAVAFGNIHLTDIRAWYEERTTAHGFAHVEPLWGTSPKRLLDELCSRGWRARIVSVNLELGHPDWLSREVDAAFAATLQRLPDVDPAGERGEYHSFVFAGPLFPEPVDFAVGKTFEREGHRIEDLLPVPPAHEAAYG